MNHLFVPYELAVIAKEKGFDEPCLARFSNDNENIEDKNFYLSPYFHTIGIKTSEIQSNKGMEREIAAPLYQQLVDWFREKHNIVVEVLVFDKGWLETDKFCFQWRVYNNSEDWFTNPVEYETPTLALKTALAEAFKLI